MTHCGARFQFDESAPGRPLETVFFSRTDSTDADLAVLPRLPEVRKLTLGLDRFTDQALVHGALVTDEGLKDLAAIATLERLSLGHTRITDRGLAFLKPSSKLTALSVRQNAVTSAGVASLEQLEHLNLFMARVDDACLEHLAGRSRLARLDLGGTEISDEGLKRPNASRASGASD